MAEELINLLGRIPGLQVASRTSAFQFLEKSEDIRDIGRKLGVDHVLEGSIRKAGNRVRISVQLVKVADGYHVWSGKYDREMEDLFDLQDEIAGKISNALEVTLMGRQTGVETVEPSIKLFSRAFGNLEAYNLYLKGRFYWNKRTEESLRRGIGYFQEAITKEPNYARAYAGLADSYALLAIYGAMPPKEAMPNAQTAASKALDLDDDLAPVYSSRACVRAAYEGDFTGASSDFQRAIELDPLYATAYHGHAMYCLIPRGLFGDALVQLEKAQGLDPLSLAINASVGLCHYFARRYDRAVEEYRKTLEIDGGFAMAHFFLGQAFERQGRAEAAIEELEKAIRLGRRSPEMVAALAQACVSAGNPNQARKLLGELRDMARDRFVSPTLRAQVHTELGERDLAFQALEDAYDRRAVDLIWLAVRPIFDPLRGDPRYDSLLERIGLKAPPRPDETTESA